MPKHPFVFLGLDEKTGRKRGVNVEKNLLTFAGAGAGKGAAQIIPNLQHWPHNVVCIDPSGEAAEKTAEEREKRFKGTVAVLDPFGYANVPARLRAAFNPLDLVEKSADLKGIADGLILRSADEPQPHFNNSAKDVAAGLLAFIKQDPELEDGERSIARLPDLIAALSDSSTKAGTIAAMKACDGFGGLARQIGQRLTPDNTEVANVLGTLRTQTDWIDEDMQAPLSRTGFLDGRRFDLRDIKEGKMSLYLVLPADKLDDYGRFLRLFTKLLIVRMMQKTEAGNHMGERCLFILDEAFACGRLNEVVSASGQMRKYGLHLWLFWQSIGQITGLYGDDGLETLSEDADALTIFGVRGMEICEFASRKIGNVRAEDIAQADRTLAKKREGHQRRQIRPYSWNILSPQDGKYIPDQALEAETQRLRSGIGRARVSPEQIKEETSKQDGEPVPRRMLVFDAQGHKWLRPLGYFQNRRKVMQAGRSPWRFVETLLAAVILLPLALFLVEVVTPRLKPLMPSGSFVAETLDLWAIIAAIGVWYWLRSGGWRDLLAGGFKIGANVTSGVVGIALDILGLVIFSALVAGAINYLGS